MALLRVAIVTFMRIILIGYGNSLRGDDAAGRLVAEAMEELHLPDVAVHSVHQLLPEHSEWLSTAQMAIFVDASADTTQTEVAIHELAPAFGNSGIGHTGDPGWALGLSMALFGSAPKAILLTIPARSFELSETVTEVTARGIANSLPIIKRIIDREKATGNGLNLLVNW